MSILDDIMGVSTEREDVNSVLDSIMGVSSNKNIGRPQVSRDEYGNTAKQVAAEKAKLNEVYGQYSNMSPTALPNGDLSIPDRSPNAIAPNNGQQVEISDDYASKRRAERIQKRNIVQKMRKQTADSDTQYINEDLRRKNTKPTSILERLANDVDDSFDDVMDYIFGKTHYKNKKEEEEAARADMNLEVDDAGNLMYSRQSNMNDEDLHSLAGEVLALDDDPEADQLIYYGRIDNPDGTSSYKIGLAGVDTFSRTAKEDRGKDITYLWAKRTKDAAKYEALFHGNKTLLESRRNDIGTDVEQYGAGKSEIYNKDFLGLDGGVSSDKLKTLNMSSESKLAELGLNITGRYDNRGMESGYKALEKAERIYGKDSNEAKELSYLMANMEHKGKKTRPLVAMPGDLMSAVGSSAQQVVAGLGDTILDAATIWGDGNSTLLDEAKSAESADKTWGYKGRKEVEALGREAVHKWKDGDYVGALMKGIQASPDTVAQSLPDMALMLYTGGAGTAVKAAQLARSKKIAEIVASKGAMNAIAKHELKKELLEDATVIAAGKKAEEVFNATSKVAKYMDIKTNRGLTAFAAKQTNNQIDERIENGDEDVDIATTGAMFASNYVLGGIDKIAFKSQLNPSFAEPLKAMMKSIPKKGMINVAKKGAVVVASLVNAGSIEAAQEWIQTYGETINAGLGTEKYGNDPFSNHFLDEATKGALLGAGAGGLTRSAGLAGGAVLNRNKRSNAELGQAVDTVVEAETGVEKEKSATSYSSVSKAYSELVGKHVGTDTTTREELEDLTNIQEDILKVDDPELMINYTKHVNKVVEKFKKEEVDLGDTKLGSKATITILKSIKDTRLDPSDPMVKKNIENIAKSIDVDANILLSTVKLTTEGMKEVEEKIGLDIEKYYTEFLEGTLIAPKGEQATEARKNVTGFLKSQQKKVPMLKHHLALAKKHFNDGNTDPYMIPYGDGDLEYKPLTGTSWQVNAKGGIAALTTLMNNATKTRTRLETLDTFMDTIEGVAPTSQKQQITSSSSTETNTETKPVTTIQGLDKAITNGEAGGTLSVQEDGVDVKFNKFVIGVDETTKTATVDFIERDINAPKGVGYRAYVALGKELAAKGYTLTSSSTQQANGKTLWEKLVKDGYAKKEGRQFKFIASTQPETKVAPETDKTPLWDTTKDKHTKDRGYDIIESPDGTLKLFKDGKAIPTKAKTLKGIKGSITKRINAKAKIASTTKEETVEETTEKPKPHTAQTRLDASYINNQSDKVQGKAGGVKLVKDILKVVQKVTNKLQDTSLKDIINNAKGTNKKVLNIILNKSATFISDTYSIAKLNSTFTVKESPMMQLLFRISPTSGKIIPDRVMPIIMHIAALNGYIENLDMLKKNKTKEDVARTLGFDDKSEVDAETYALFRSKGTFMRDLADSLGRQVLKEAGYKQAKNTTPEEYGRIAAELGTAVIMMMQKEGLVEIHALSTQEVNSAINNTDKISNKEANIKMVSAIAVGKDITTVATEQRRILTAVEEELDMDLSLDTNIPKTKPLPVEKKLKIHHSDTNAEGPKEMLKVKNKLQKQEWTIDDTANELLTTMDEDTKLKYMGYVDPTSEEYLNSSYDRQIEIDGQNENIEASLAALDHDSVKPTGYVLGDYYKGAKGRASLYFEYFVSKNFRYFIKSSGLNPQTDKLHRFIVHGMKAIATYNRNNTNDMFSFKYAVAQGFGYKVDGSGKTRNMITTEFQRLVDRTYKVIKKEFDDGDADIGAGELGHYINAMGALKAYEDSIANGSNTFESNALAEIDHKTNGFAHKLMQYPVLPTKLMKLSLNQVGVWTELTNEDTTKIGGLDPYQSNALGFTQNLVKTALDNNKVPKGVKTFIQNLDENSLLTFVTDGDVTSELRNIMKPLFMVFNYSAGIKSIKRTLAYTLSSKMLNKLVLNSKEENNRVFLKVLSDARVEKGTTIEEQIRTKPPQNIKIKIDGLELSLFEYLSKSYEAIYGDTLKTSFAKYDAIKEINSISNVAFRAMFEVFMQQFEKVIEGNPTQPEIDAWLTENKHLIPNVVTSHGDNTPLHIVDTLKQAAAEHFATITKFGTATVVADGKMQQSITSNPTVKAFKAAVSSGAVLPIHSIDGDNMTRVLDENPEVLGVHDADVTGAKGLKKVAKSANKHFYQIHKEYSIMQEVLKAFKTIQAEAKDDISIPVSEVVAELFGVAGKVLNLAQIAATLESTAKEVNEAREKLFAGDMTVENMIYNNDGAHKVDQTKGDTTIGSKTLSDLTEDEQSDLADEMFLLSQKEVEKLELGETPITDLLPSILAGFGSSRKRYKVIKATINDALAITVKIQDPDTGNIHEYGFGESSTNSVDTGRKLRIDRPLITDEIRDRQFIADETGRMFSSDNQTNADINDRLAEDLSTNTEAILDMVDTLNEQTGNETDQTTINNLKEMLSMFDTEFLNKTSLYIKELATNEESRGNFDYKSNQVSLYLSQKSNRQYDNQQLPVIYAHEMLHALVFFAMQSNDIKAKAIMRRLNYVYNAAAKVITVEDFINDSNPNKADALLKAKSGRDYVFGNNKQQGLAEFISYGLTLPKVVAKLKASELRENKKSKGFFNTLLGLVKKLLSLVLGGAKLKDYSVDMYENLQNLAVALSVHNNRAINKIEKEPSAVKVFLDNTNEQLVSLIQGIKNISKNEDGYLPTPPGKDASRVTRILWLAKLFPRLLTDNKHRGTLVFMLDSMYMKPTGFLQNIIRNILTPDNKDLERSVENLKDFSDEIDKVKKDVSETVAKGISNAFNKDSYLTPQQDSDLLDIVVDLDMSSLLEEFTIEEIAEILKDGNHRRKLIAKYEAKIKAEARESRWVVNQAKVLGYFMVHGIIDEAYNTNAYNIIQGRLLKTKPAPVANPNLEATVDKLATLYGIEYSDKDTVTRAAELANNIKGMTTLLNTLATIKRTSLKMNFDNDKTKMLKGYVVEVSPNTIDILIRPIKEKKTLKNEGYELKFESPESDVTSTEPMGIFVMENNSNTTYTRGATLLGNEVAKGSKLANILGANEAFSPGGFALAKAKANVRLQESRAKAVAEDIDPEKLFKDRIGNSLTPVFDESEKIKDYKYLMSKQNKKEILQLNRRASKVVGITFAGVSNKVSRAEHNENIMELITKDMKENYDGTDVGENLYPYTTIGKYADNKEGKEIYKVLPFAFRQFIDNHPDKTIAVRADMLHEYFGYKNIALMNTSVSKHLPRAVVKQAKLAGKVWEGIVDIYSTDITIRTPDVVLSNTVSNGVYLLQLGYSPTEVELAFREFTPLVYEHIDAHKKLMELQIKVQINTATKADKRKIKRLEEQIANNAVIEEVIQEGMLGNIVEEVVSAGDNDTGDNIVREFVRKQVDKLPEVAQVGLDNMYVTKNTEAYKNIERAVQMGDFIARVVLNNFLRKEGMPKKKRMIKLKDAFVNYGKLYSRLEEYGNRMGAFKFTKYAKGSQRAFGVLANEKPLYALMSLLAQELLLDVDDVLDQNILTRSYRSMKFNPADILTTVATPDVLRPFK